MAKGAVESFQIKAGKNRSIQERTLRKAGPAFREAAGSALCPPCYAQPMCLCTWKCALAKESCKED